MLSSILQLWVFRTDCTSTTAWDVFINCAAFHSPTPATIQGSDEDDWWKTFELGVRSVQYFTKSFMPKAKPGATYISMNSDTAFTRPEGLPKMAAYTASKLATAKLEEYLSVENPGLRTFTVSLSAFREPKPSVDQGQSRFNTRDTCLG
jgi:NAD(P)-dependent dehydrogenase (short-subunit alcohol dehydrogenase family)